MSSAASAQLAACAMRHAHVCWSRLAWPADLPGLPGVWAAVRYLVHLNEAEADLIQARLPPLWLLHAWDPAPQVAPPAACKADGARPGQRSARPAPPSVRCASSLCAARPLVLRSEQLLSGIKERPAADAWHDPPLAPIRSAPLHALASPCLALPCLARAGARGLDPGGGPGGGAHGVPADEAAAGAVARAVHPVHALTRVLRAVPGGRAADGRGAAAGLPLGAAALLPRGPAGAAPGARRGARHTGLRAHAACMHVSQQGAICMGQAGTSHTCAWRQQAGWRGILLAHDAGVRCVAWLC